MSLVINAFQWNFFDEFCGLFEIFLRTDMRRLAKSGKYPIILLSGVGILKKLIKRLLEETQHGGKGQCGRLKSIGCQLPTTKLFCAACVQICTVCAA